MALRKANSYSKKRTVPYTRIGKRKGKSYIKTVPSQKIVKFTMGKERAYEKGKLPYVLTVRSTEKVQIRHNSLESCRQYINRKLEKQLSGNYMFKVVPYPHHVQRENKMLTGAGADRMQTGMQLAFGKVAGKSALLKSGSEIFVIAVANPTAETLARKLIKQIRPKMPGKIRVDFKNLNKENK
ncbi:MAG TPA: 50S ribosomal protein L16 [Candidatus Nanoarchaeia archaeon]|nr:50S ribosomal protein L16 [Candidatus Nanoarchaeia archaeon]